MIRGRESSDHWAHKAHQILDQAREGHGQPEHIEWALAYLGDTDGPTKIPCLWHRPARARTRAEAVAA